MNGNLRYSVRLPAPAGGIVFKNPVLAASGTFGYGLEFMPFGDLKALGGFVVKGLSLRPRQGNPMPRLAETASGMLNAVGLQNCGAEAFIRDKLPLLPWKDTAVIANLYATDENDYAALAEILSAEPGIAALEVNVSCPNVKAGGMLFGQDPRLAGSATEAVKKKARGKPVIIKLSPNVTDIAGIARACQEAGADALSCINTVQGMAVDFRSRASRVATLIAGLSGPAIKPVALRCVWQVSRAVTIPVIGLGGITCAADVLEFILVGAGAVQIGTGNFLRPDTAFRIAAELPGLMAEEGITDLDAYRGSLRV
jgi:dihydroorotate dehydrogenase (NAD+) catalytic subunit